jgi:hypothetical protein
VCIGTTDRSQEEIDMWLEDPVIWFLKKYLMINQDRRPNDQNPWEKNLSCLGFVMLWMNKVALAPPWIQCCNIAGWGVRDKTESASITLSVSLYSAKEPSENLTVYTSGRS